MKTVYKVEETKALNRIYHKTCFKCGCGPDSKQDGNACKKSLKLNDYVDHSGEPYCTPCYGKLFKPKGYGFSNTLETFTSYGDGDKAPVQSFAPSSSTTTEGVTKAIEKVSVTPKLNVFKEAEKSTAATAPDISKPKGWVPDTPKCTICAKSVYKNEEIRGLGRLWHKSCFTCGATNTSDKIDGCKKSLKLNDYVDHSNIPYCNTCYGRLFKPKGFGVGTGLSTAAAYEKKADADEAPKEEKPYVPTYVSSGGSNAFATKLKKTDLLPTPAAKVAETPSAVPAPSSASAVSSPVDDVETVFAAASPQGSARVTGIVRKSISTLHSEHTYVGNNDEVQEDEWK